jgi:transducin (beta)-like 1
VERTKTPRARKTGPAVGAEDESEASGGKGKGKATLREKKKDVEEEKDTLPVPTPTARRSRSPAKKEKAKETPIPTPAPAPVPGSSSNPRWIQPGDVGSFFEHRDIVNCVAWNISNPEILASSSNDSTARFWELRPSTDPGCRRLEMATDKAKILSHKSMESTKKSIPAVSWHPEGSLIATAASDAVGRLFTPNGSLGGILSYGRGPINAIKFSPSGSMVLTATQRHSVHLFTVGGDTADNGENRMVGPQMVKSFEGHTGESLLRLQSRALTMQTR